MLRSMNALNSRSLTAPADSSTPDKEDFVRSLANGLKVMECFAEADGPLTLSDVARRTGLSRASARRMLSTLVHLDYALTDGRGFTLTPKVLSLGLGFRSIDGIRDVIDPALRDLSAALGESSSASVLMGEDIVYVARVHTRRIMRMNLEVGTRLPAFATSMGRVLLASMDGRDLMQALRAWNRPQLTPATITDVTELVTVIHQARQDGFALVDQELEVGLRSVSVPVVHPERGVLTALNVSVSAGLESPEESLLRVLPSLRDAAEKTVKSILTWERGKGIPFTPADTTTATERR